MLLVASLVGLSLTSIAVAQISDDFEHGWNQTKWPVYAPDCNQGGQVSLDSSTAHSGKYSMRVDGAAGYCGHIFFGTTDIPNGDVYVRAYVKPSIALGESHVTFITMPDAAQGSDKHLRVSGQSEIVMYNRESDDATLPDLSPSGINSSTALTAGSWQCFEYHLGSDGTIETWLNGTPVTGLTFRPNGTNANANGWLRSTYVADIQGVYFGWEAYGGATNTFWYDDIVVSSGRAGCNSTT